tara:strand:+ start:150 stop:1130 length:981 start_codon:yes stop_codon:yes gene_type:complete
MYKLKTSKPIIIVSGEPNSVFSEILIKAFKSYNCRKPIVVIGSHKLFIKQMRKLNKKANFNLINSKSKSLRDLKRSKINFIDINYVFKKPFEDISSKSNSYISKCFKMAFTLIKNNRISGLINGPVSKKYFLKNKYPGITEYLSKSFNINKKFCMLIYEKNLSVSPITTHLPINRVTNNINRNDIVTKTLLISNFFKQKFNKKPKIAMTGLNPHCENFFKKSEEIKIIEPAIKDLKKRNVNISGPMPADTVFLKENSKKFDVIVGMYHDQVLAPIKALHGFNAINITLGLPFLRISPDHGPNFKMVGKNKSNPKSLIQAIKFLDRL